MQTDNQFLADRFLNNKTANNTEKVIFLKGAEIVGIGFTDIGRYLMHRESIIYCVYEAYGCALDYFQPSLKTIWNRDKEAGKRVAKYFGEKMDLVNYDRVIAYTMLIPRQDIIEAAKSDENYDVFETKLEGYGKAYDNLMGKATNGKQKSDNRGADQDETGESEV